MKTIGWAATIPSVHNELTFTGICSARVGAMPYCLHEVWLAGPRNVRKSKASPSSRAKKERLASK